MSNNADSERVPAFTVTVRLSPQAIETMSCLFLHGPTYDGNIPSKSGRDELFDLKLATRTEGWSWLTADGVRMALANRMDRDKERWERERRRRVIKLEQIEQILSANEMGAQCQQQSTAQGQMVQGLEKLLEPEAQGRVGD